MQTSSQRRRRSVCAIVCLLVVVMLYAPLAGAAWSSYQSACCTSDQCPIPEHHHHKSPAAPANYMDCGHDMAGMMACRMSCCHNPENPAVASTIFVLPLPFVFSAPGSHQSGIVSLQSLDSPRSIEPLSPPPRFVSAVA
jgi:hypothetical protein